MNETSITDRATRLSAAASPRPSYSLSEQPFRGLTFTLEVFGCQMNKHDGERIAGALEALGALEVSVLQDADIVIYLTCCVREGAEQRTDGQIASMKSLSLRPDSPIEKRIVAVGGCIAQKDQERIFKALPHVDIVFGTHNVNELPALIKRTLSGESRVLSVEFGDGNGASSMPARRERPWSAWVSIITGCDNFCSYCIVPYVRGRESSRPFEEIVDEVEALADEGVAEVTLLGQNVNSYGRDRYGAPRFAELLAAIDATGVERIRFATSHPKDLSDDVIEAFGRLDHLAPALHLPVQSGSNAVLAAMNRGYTRERYLGLVDKLRASRDDIALSTDIIVGFPGETERDFEDTLALVEAAHFHQAFTFIYSPRESTAAARLPQTSSREEIQQRFNRLVDLVQAQAESSMHRHIGETMPVLVDGSSERNPSMLAGRGPGNQMVHAPVRDPREIAALRGRIIDVTIETAHPWYLQGTIV